MRIKSAKLLGLACLILALKGDNCILEERESEFVVRADVPAVWHTEGDDQISDVERVEAAEEVNTALENLSGDSVIESINISGVCYEVLANNGIDGSHEGMVTVDSLGIPIPLLEFDVPSNAIGVTGGTAGAQVSLKSRGVRFINSRLNTYLASEDPDLLDFTFRANWSNTPAMGNYNFDWKTCLILQIKGTLVLDVYDP